jgi:ADP-heptose:LPS heptosyltransferase
MYKATLSKDYMGCKAGDTILLERANAGHVLVMQKPLAFEEADPGQAHGEGGHLIVRPGGIGDLVHLGVSIREVAKKSGRKVDVAVAERYASVVKHNPNVRKVIHYPTPANVFDQYEVIHWLEDSVEDETDLHMADAFLEHCGFDHTQYEPTEKSPELYLPKSIKRKPKPKRKRVGFQLKASAKCRTPDPALMAKVMEIYFQEGWDVWIFGAPGEVTTDEKSITNTTQWDKPPSILESASYMQTCDLFIAPDSGLLHIAGALKIPSVGLYGPFPADLRVRYSPYCVAVEAKAPCAPCFWHGRGAHFPPGCPGAKAGKCIVTAAIQPETIVRAGELAMQKKFDR